MTVWDVAVVGAGPAGASAARVAAQAGASTLLIERATLPRYKRCGGGLIGASQKALSAAGLDLESLTRDRVGRLSFTHDGRRAFTRSTAPFLPMVLRSELDAALVELATAAGAQLRTGTTVTAYDETAGVVTLTTAEGEIRARSVVGADGSGGRAASYVGAVFDQVDLGMEAELPAQGWQGHVLLDWGPVPGSYGWVFPKGETVTVGVIGARACGPAIKDYYAGLLARLGLDRATATQDGGHLTKVRAPGSPLRRGRVLLAGDAGGLLEPWTREGISFALRSGTMAGTAAVGELASYERTVQQELSAEVDAGRTALQVFTKHPGVVHTTLRAMPRVWPLFVRLVGGETSLTEQLGRRRVRALAVLLG